MMPSVSLHQLRLSSYQFERNAKQTGDRGTGDGDAKCHTQQRWSEQPASSTCNRPWAPLRYDDDDEQASGFQKSGQSFWRIQSETGGV